jgi:type IV pilus assembly protein PilA
MSTLKNLHRQAKARRDGKPAFTLLELIVVLLVLGILAAIAVPTFNRVKENSVVRVAQTTLEAAARNGEAIAKSDGDATDEQIATLVESEFTAGSGLTVSVNGDTITVSQSNGSATASGSVEFNNGVPTITNATISGGGSPTTTVAPAPSYVTLYSTTVSSGNFTAPGGTWGFGAENSAYSTPQGPSANLAPGTVVKLAMSSSYAPGYDYSGYMLISITEVQGASTYVGTVTELYNPMSYGAWGAWHVQTLQP